MLNAMLTKLTSWIRVRLKWSTTFRVNIIIRSSLFRHKIFPSFLQ
jgi:hypothetical protein